MCILLQGARARAQRLSSDAHININRNRRNTMNPHKIYRRNDGAPATAAATNATGGGGKKTQLELCAALPGMHHKIQFMFKLLPQMDFVFCSRRVFKSTHTHTVMYDGMGVCYCEIIAHTTPSACCVRGAKLAVCVCRVWSTHVLHTHIMYKLLHTRARTRAPGSLMEQSHIHARTACSACRCW